MNAGGRDGRQDACAPKVNGIRGVPNCTEPPRDCHTRGCVASQPQLVSSGDYRRPASPPEAGRPRNDRWGGVGTGVPTQRNDVASLRSAPQVLIPRITRALPSADGRVARDDMGVEEVRRRGVPSAALRASSEAGERRGSPGGRGSHSRPLRGERGLSLAFGSGQTHATGLGNARRGSRKDGGRRD